MKHYRFIISFVVIFVLLATTSFGQAFMLFYDGGSHDSEGKTFATKVFGTAVQTDVPAVLLYDKYAMVPLRAVFEAMGAAVEWNGVAKSTVIKLDSWVIELKQEEKDFLLNGKTCSLEVPVKSISNGGYGRTMLPLSFFSSYLKMKVDYSLSEKVINIERGGYSSTPVSGTNPLPQVSQKPAVSPSASPRPTVSPTPVPTPTPTGSPKATPQATPGKSPAVTPGPTPVPSASPDLSSVQGRITDVFHYNYGGNEHIVIMQNKVGPYNVIRQSDPNRLVFEFLNTRAEVEGSRATSVSGSIIKRFGLEQYDSVSARVTLEVEGMPQYTVEVLSDRILIFVKKSNLKNMTYTNDKDRVCLRLEGAKLTEGGMYLKKLYKEEYNSDGTVYIIAFPGTQANLNTGIMHVNDRYLDTIEVSKNPKTSEYTLTFFAKERLAYNIITRPEENDVAITILKPYSASQRLVVIDPGHGGCEPGAVSSNVYEKNLNLDIALRLKSLLKSKNVNTYIIREDDSFVGLYERAYIANSLNASLFLSIHNNALSSPDYAGTMTLYTQNNPNDTKLVGKWFAQTIQNALVQRLKSIDRKIINRPELVVLKATKMPSALAEVGFMTNKAELSKLLKENYRQEAAQALFDAIVKSLSEMK